MTTRAEREDYERSMARRGRVPKDGFKILKPEQVDLLGQNTERPRGTVTGRDRIPTVGPGSNAPSMISAEGRGVPARTPAGPAPEPTGDERLMSIIGGLAGGIGGRGVANAAAKRISAPIVRRAAPLAGETVGAGLGSEAASDEPGAFMRGAGGNLIGAGLGKGAFEVARRVPGLNRVLTPLSEQRLIPGAREADLLLRQRGEGLLLSQGIDAPWIQNAERMADSAMLGGPGALGRAQLSAESAAKDIAEKYATSVIGSRNRQEVGAAVEHFLTKKYGAFQSAAGQLYKQADATALGTVIVDLKPVQDEAAKLLNSGAIKGDTGQRILMDIISREPTASFKHAHELRSSLVAVSREANAVLPGQAEQFSKKLAPLVEKQMEEGAKMFNPAAYAQYRKASEFYRRGVAPFNNDAVQAILRKDPEAVAKYLVPLSGNFKTSAIQAIHAASKGDTRAIDALRGHYVTELFRSAGKGDATDAVVRSGNAASADYISGDKLLKMLNQDTAALQSLLGRKGHAELLGLASAMARAEKKPGALGDQSLGTASKYARLFVPVGGGLAAAFGGPEIGTGATTMIFFSPNVANHMLANRTLRRWLIGGDAPPPGSATFSRGLGQIMSHALWLQRTYGRDSVRIVPAGEKPKVLPVEEMQ